MILYRFTRFFFRVFAKMFLHLKVEGEENLPKEGGFILAVNHESSLDPFVITAAIPRYIRWLVIYEYYDLWYLRWALRWMRFIRIENILPKEAFRALKQAEVLGVFPEGRRSWDGRLGQPRPGVAALARRAATPVVPVAIRGTFAALPRTKRCLKLRPVNVRIGAPLFFSETANKENKQTDEENSRRIMQAIAQLLY